MKDIQQGYWAPRPLDMPITFCEGNTSAYGESFYLAEFHNSITNFAYIIAGIIGLRRVLLHKLPREILIIEVSLVMTGIGSFAFHMTQSRWGQFLDKIPMVFIGLGVDLTLKYVHPFAEAPWFDKAMCLLALIAIIGNAIFKIHDIFMVAFTIQIVTGTVLSFEKSSKHTRFYFLYFSSLLIAKLFWEGEQYFVRNDFCPLSKSHFSYYFHAYWHILSASAAAFWTKYVANRLLYEKGNLHGKKKC